MNEMAQAQRESGFTLIEMLIVIVVIAILIGVLLPNFRGTQDEAAEQRARSELRTIATALESYYIHNSNAYPAALSSLITATPRIISVIPDDPFRAAGTDYSYALDTTLWLIAGPSYDVGGETRTQIGLAPIGVAYP